MRLRAMKKQTQNKPNLNPIKACPERIEFTLSLIEGNGPISSKAKMNLKLLARKSGHTRHFGKNLDSGLSLIFPTMTLECLAEKQRFLTK